jgi:hypothetical protein
MAAPALDDDFGFRKGVEDFAIKQLSTPEQIYINLPER